MRIATPYKHPNSGIYYFRRAVPNDCRRILNRTIIKESLHTREPYEARRLFAVKQDECEKLFESARSGCINVNSNQHNVNDTKLVVGTTTLQELFDKFNIESNQSVKGLNEAQKVVNRFIGVYGSIAAETISGAMIREFKELLIYTPSILPECLRTKSLRKIVREMNGKYNGRTLSDSSINKHLSVLSSVLQWASDNSYFNDNWHNPVRGKTIRRKSSQRDRLPFTAGDLDKIFASDVYTNQLRPKGGAGGAAYWIPIIALYTGMRLEEIGQLLVGDVKCEDNIWYFDVNSSEDKQLKTKSSVRRVPIHYDLIELEFITYVKELECSRVFPLLKPDIYGRLTQNWSKWFGRHLTKLGVNDDSKVFHSFRHLMKDALRNSEVDEAVSDAITGHSSSSIGRSYGKGYGLSMLNKAIQSIKYEGLTIERN